MQRIDRNLVGGREGDDLLPAPIEQGRLRNSEVLHADAAPALLRNPYL